MISLLVDALSSLGLEVFRQGSLSEDAPYPEAFYTFWSPMADGRSFYDNVEHAVVWEFVVYYYTSDVRNLESGLMSAIEALRAIGFVIGGKGFDVASDEVSHVGRAFRAQILEKE